MGHPAASLFLGSGEVRLVEVAKSDDLHVLVDEEGVEQLVATVADADEAEANTVVAAEDGGDASGVTG